MALIDTTRIRLRATPAERVALAAAAWISTCVAHRMAQRADRAAETLARQNAIDDVTRRRDQERARAHLLGIR
ncbi:hypothetical protein [Microbacterium flavum]|uniref:Uncharacterized protein n=1 Tax=Microbacterium flavum TaxID=415216 RepID=A0ABS5XVB4_9MICO|nr:hypothetical protein [Microbacterium flavum]MBT8798477.1 hypothetical protein [Microbacterium flavum]